MAEKLNQLANQILQKIDEVQGLYYRLILVRDDATDDGMSSLQKVSRQTAFPIVNVNLGLSRSLLELTKRQRTLRASALMNQIISDVDGETVLLDNIQILFEPSLRQDPLRLLQGLARNKTIVVAWPGEVDDEQLTYAEQGHPEYRRYQTRDVVLID